MSREIKFRMWYKKTKIMYDVEKINIKNKLLNMWNSKFYSSSLFSFDEVELMQYTGLKDKNGVEIYEGDILLAPAYFGSLKCVCIYQQENTVSSIQGFGLYSYDSYFQTYRTLVESDEWDDFEVIGNIYENPELLKVGEEE